MAEKLSQASVKRERTAFQRRPSMFEKAAFSHVLKERLKEGNHEVIHTRQPNIDEDGNEIALDSKDVVMIRPTFGKVKYANTYKMEADRKFQVHLVKRKAYQILKDNLENIQYDPDLSARLCVSLADAIMAAVKDIGFDRYKYIVRVFIVEKKNQGTKIVSRFIWDDQRDNWVGVSFERHSFISTAIIYALYFE
ncbi:dynein light chain Tctex-type protein 2 [Protopterus annectens]|uniref:dynein light chain Tctex-type protein 2 n=1 Tax=Protopterus annectens TaxID=7888 RepID=UPI001CFAC14E|nr:dynein light chain Tctex-type protein 2 [Protopterus annectens]